MSQPVASGFVLSAPPDEAQDFPLAVDRHCGGGQGLVRATSMTVDSLVGIHGEAEPEASQGPRPAKPGGKAGQGVIPSPNLPSSWRRSRKMAVLLGPLPPPPPCILHVITKCNLVWGAEGFLSMSA